MFRFADSTLGALSLTSALAGAALAACGVPEDPITFASSFRVESFQIFPSPPVAGERVHFEVTSASVFELELTQGTTKVFSAVKPPDTTRASFIAATSDVPSLWARGRDFAETTAIATTWAETCHADGVWSTALTTTSPECSVADEDLSTALFEVLVGGELVELAGRSGAGRRNFTPGVCRFDFTLAEGESAVLRPIDGTLEVTLTGATAAGEACVATWSGAATRD
jgi:hypothetical protein